MDAIRTVNRMIERNQLASQRVEYAERLAWLAREIRTHLNIVSVERVADGVNAGLQRSMPCYNAALCGNQRCGECGR